MRIFGLVLLAGVALPGQVESLGVQHERALAVSQQSMKAWLRHDDPKALYTPHNSGADLYP